VYILIYNTIILFSTITMAPPIDVTEINSVEDAQKALQTWKISKERAEFIAQALETIEKPELEDTNFRIDSTNRKEKTDKNWFKVLENPEGDVREYLDGNFHGEQLFTGDKFDDNWAIIKEWSATRETKKLGKKLPASWTTYRDIINKKYAWNYQDFLRWENILFPGYRNNYSEHFGSISEMFSLHCADGSRFYGDKNNGSHKEYDSSLRNYGSSVRCLKSA